MAKLLPSGLETHPSGTTGKNAIIIGNWQRLNAILDPALDDSDPVYADEYGALARAVDGQASSVLDLGSHSSGTVTVDMKAGAKQKITATGNITIAFNGKKSGRKITLYVYGSGGTRTITWPGSAVWHNNTALTSVVSGGVLAIDVASLSTTDATLVLK